jgi:hypothetical protein
MEWSNSKKEPTKNRINHGGLGGGKPQSTIATVSTAGVIHLNSFWTCDRRLFVGTPPKHDTQQPTQKIILLNPASASSSSTPFVTPTTTNNTQPCQLYHRRLLLLVPVTPICSLLSHYYGMNGDSPSEQDSPTTILSRQFDGTQSLFEVAARLADGKDLLNDALITNTDKNATTKMTA